MTDSDTRATSAWVYDMTTHTVLMDKNGETSLPPASMSKLMTVNMLFEALKDGRVTMDTTFAVSAHAVSFTEAGGSTMYLQQGDRPTVEQLIHGMIINSGNDACVVVAEGLAGFDYVLSEDLGRKLGVSKLPYAVLIDEEGRIASLGLVNNREHLESLFEAKERRVASIQEYLARG